MGRNGDGKAARGGSKCHVIHWILFLRGIASPQGGKQWAEDGAGSWQVCQIPTAILGQHRTTYSGGTDPTEQLPITQGKGGSFPLPHRNEVAAPKLNWVQHKPTDPPAPAQIRIEL